MVSEPWLCSLLSVSSAACRLIHSFSKLSLLRSSRQHLSCSSRTLASSCCSCLLLSVWVLRSLVAASDSARSKVLASSSWRPQEEKKENIPYAKELMDEGLPYVLNSVSSQQCAPLKHCICQCLTCFCKWMFFSFEMWEFWFRLFKSSNWSRRPLTVKEFPEQLQTTSRLNFPSHQNCICCVYNKS